MKALRYIVALLGIVTTVACNSTTHHPLDTTSLYTPRYAKYFEVVTDNRSGERLLCIKNPWQGTEDVAYYAPIDSLAAQHIVAMSSSYVAMLDAIGCTDRITAISGCRFISTPSARRAIDEGRIVEAGYNTTLDFESFKQRHADLVLLYGVAGEAKSTTDKLDALHIPYLYIGDYLEEEPLGRAEWIVALAYVCDCEELGKSIFAEIETRYIALRDQQMCHTSRPRVMLNLPYRDSWFMPSAESYAVRLIEDAGGEYIYTKGKGNASKSISLEEALLLASRSDVWLNLGQVSSLDELRRAAPRFADIKAVREGRIYNNIKRSTPSGGSDFWESGSIRPDIVLADLVKILHHKAPTDSLYYYTKLE
jgi:iron complex transport system substrate-binding protein